RPASDEPRTARNDEPAGHSRGISAANGRRADRRDPDDPAAPAAGNLDRSAHHWHRGALARLPVVFVSPLFPAPPRASAWPTHHCRLRAIGLYPCFCSHRNRAGRQPMMLLTVGCNFRDTPVELREKLAFAEAGLPRTLSELSVRYGCEAVILSTCNRVELYLGWAVPPLQKAGPVQEVFDAELSAEFLGEWPQLPAAQLRPHLYQFRDREAVHHLFRVASSLDSMIVGEGQIAGQVKQAYEQAQQAASVGALLHALFQQARVVAKRV